MVLKSVNFFFFFYFSMISVSAFHHLVDKMEVWSGREPLDGRYRLATVPFDKMLHQSVRFKKYSIGPYSFETRVTKILKHVAIITDVTERCVQAFSSNIFTGSCDLHPMCVGVESRELEHTWYGSKVTFCAGHDSQAESRIVKKQIEIAHIEFHSPLIIPKNLAYLRVDDNLIAVPAIYVRAEFGNYSLIDVINPRGDWHTIIYNAYPLRDWYHFSLRATVTYAQYDPKEFFLFTCGENRANRTDYGNKYDSPDCGTIIPFSSNYGYCSNAPIYTPRRCPLDFLPRRLNAEPFEKLIYIKSSKASWIESLVESLFRVLADITRPVVEEVIRVLIDLLGNTIEAFSNVLLDIEPVIENLILNLTKVVKALIPILVRVSITIIRAIGEVLRTVNYEYILFEISLLVLVLSLRFGLLTIIIAVVYVLYYFGFDRRDNHLSLSQILNGTYIY